MPTLTYEPIATISLTSLSTYEFTSIPSGYRDLRVVFWGGSATGDIAYWRINTTSSAGSYYHTRLYGNGTTLTFETGTNNALYAPINTGLTTGNRVSTIILDVFGYTDTSIYKPCIIRTFNDKGTGGEVNIIGGSFRSTSAVTKISFTVGSSTFQSGSMMTLYGIAG